MERKDAIEILTDMYNYYSNTDDYDSYVPFDKEDKEALEMAINSLKTDEAYQLEYEATTKNDLVVDAVSRKELLKIYEDRFSELQKLKHLKDNKGAEDRQMGVNYCINILKELSSVTPIRPKGHWTEEFNDLEGEVRFTCSSCGKYQLFGTDFCYHCGSDNREVVEE
jgi:hypothetical protein